MNNDAINLHTVFIGKPQWEAGWPYIGYDNEKLIEAILNHLKEKFLKINFTHNEIVGIYEEELISKINQQSLESVRSVISKQFGYISNVLMVDKHLIKTVLNAFLIDFHKISLFSLLKVIKLLKKPRYFQLYPEIPPYTLLKKKRNISFLKDLLAIVIDKHDF